MKKKYILLSFTQAISQLGSYFTNFAIIWIIIDKSNSSIIVASYLSYSTFLYSLFALIGGKILDIFPRKKIIIISDLIGFICLFFLTLYEKFQTPPFYVYFIITFFTNLSGTILMLGTQTILGDFGDNKETAKAQASFETTKRTFMIISPLLAGVLLKIFERWQIFAFDSITYLISMFGSIAFIPNINFKNNKTESKLINWIIPKIEWNITLIKIVISAILINLIYIPLFLIWPVITKLFNKGSEFMGLISTMFSIGSIMGGLWIIKMKNINVYKQVSSSMLIISLGYLILFLSLINPYFLLFPALVLGLGFGSISGPIMSIIHSNIPCENKGQFFGWLGFIGQIGQPLVTLLSGFISQKLGIWYLLSFLLLASFFVYGITTKINNDTNLKLEKYRNALDHNFCP
jgi:MFS family permease